MAPALTEAEAVAVMNAVMARVKSLTSKSEFFIVPTFIPPSIYGVNF